jgi:hypothetical protein
LFRSLFIPVSCTYGYSYGSTGRFKPFGLFETNIMKPIFHKNITYSEDLLNLYAQLHDLEITDCIKDDGEMTIAAEEEGEPVWVFEIDKNNMFKLIWQDDEYLSNN